MTLKAFVASTYEDLAAHRSQAIRALRKFEIHVDPMEDWTATTSAPKHFSPGRLDGCQLCILLVGFRRGHIPTGGRESITQLEYQAALDGEIAVFPYLLDGTAEWDDRFDKRDVDQEIDNWRDDLVEHHGVGFFEAEPTSIFSLVQSAVGRWLHERFGADLHPLQFADNLVDLATYDLADVATSHVSDIERTLSEVIGFGRHDVIEVDLGAGNAWWSTRLFLLASLIQDYTDVRLVAIKAATGYVGMTTPVELAVGLVAAEPGLPNHYKAQDRGAESAQEAMSESARRFAESFGGRESTMKTWVTAAGLSASPGVRIDSDRVPVSSLDYMETPLFLHDVKLRRGNHVAVVNREDSLVSIIDRVRLVSELADDGLAARLR